MVDRHLERLRVVFQRALVTALGTSALACSSASSPAGAPDATTSEAGDAPDAGDDAGGMGFDLDANIPDALSWCEAGPPTFLTQTTCEDFYRSPCGLPDKTVASDAGQLNAVQCSLLCPRPHRNGNVWGCGIYTGPTDAGTDADSGEPTFDLDGSAPGTLILGCQWCNNGGRRPPGFREGRRARAGGAAGAFFAQMAELEAASVTAFRQLRRELLAHRAPAALVDAVRAARADERRHARDVGALSRAFGGRPRPRRAGLRPARLLEEIARDNAVEGCVRETFGALVACWQARHAARPEVRRAMRAIAGDELRHAALSWALAEWLDTRLDAPARARVREARRRAVERLRLDARAPVPRALVRDAGAPDAAAARALFDACAAAWM